MNIFKAVLGASCAAAMSLGVIAFSARSWMQRPITLTAPRFVVIEKDEKLDSLAEQLAQAGLIDGAFVFGMYVKLFEDYRKFQAGRYQFLGEVSPKQLVEAFVEGNIYHELVLELTVPEGFNLHKIFKRAASFGYDYKQLWTLAHTPKFIASFGINSKSLEGFLFPETYQFFDERPTPEELMTKMVKQFFANLPEGYRERVQSLGLTLEQAVNFASLIEKETKAPEEANLISEVIWNRLHRKIPLGVDATIIYGIKNYDGNIRTVHLKDKTNPYNTRFHAGLPPTPIASPSTASLLAVTTPTRHGYYYYVLNPKDPTRHQFSRTLEEHNRGVRSLVKSQRK